MRRRSRIETRRGLGVFAWILVVLGCAIPGRLYPVAPAISGRVHSGDVLHANAQLTLHVVHVESAELYARKDVPLSPDGRFEIEAPELVVAGHEYSKRYGAFLHLRAGDEDLVIWRAQFSRLELVGPVALDCDLGRPLRHGQPCWVENPLEQPWLVRQGERTFERLCSSCHGADGGGVEGGVAVAPGSTPPDLRRIAARRGGRFDRAEIAEWIEGRSVPDAHGTRTMPVWGQRLSAKYERYSDHEGLVGATLDPLVTYLESLQRADQRTE